MNKLCYVTDLTDIANNECFKDASAGELRVLLVLAEYSKRPIDIDRLAELAGVSLARTKSAVSLFEAAGLILPEDSFAAVKIEFGECKTDISAKEVARDIRNEELADLIDECTALMGVGSLVTEDIKVITALATDTVLTPEYIVTLLAFLKSTAGETKKITAKKLRAEAQKLLARDIDTLEALEAYIKDKSCEFKDEWEYRRILQLWGRAFSRTEREYVKKWAHVYAFSTAIVAEAYEIAILKTQKLSFPYMDTLLTDWYTVGCKTVEECRARASQTSAMIKNDTKAKKGGRKTKEADVPKYSNFDAEEAMQRAIERSFGERKN